MTRHLHVAFAAHSREEVDAFWQAGTDAGYASDGEPGLRPQYHPTYYSGFLLDPDGTAWRPAPRAQRRRPWSSIDHLWLGVRELGASRQFWETVAPVLSLEVTDDREGRSSIVWAGDRSFALVADGRPPTENLHLAFPVADDEAVAEFHGSRPRPDTATTARPANGRCTTRATSAPSSSTPAETTSRR